MAELKSMPVKCWDATTKTWWFPEIYMSIVVALLKQLWPEARELDVNAIVVPAHMQGTEVGRRMARGDSLATDAYTVLGVTPEAPDCVVKAAYVALKKELDPDTVIGGSPEPLLELETAWAQISSQRG